MILVVVGLLVHIVYEFVVLFAQRCRFRRKFDVCVPDTDLVVVVVVR